MVSFIKKIYINYYIMNIYSCIDLINIEKIFVLYYSIYLNSSNFFDYNFYLLVDDDPKDVIIPSFLRGRIKIEQFIISDEWEELLMEFNKYFYKKCSWCKNDMNFARFFIFDVFTDLERVVYLDWDMIVQADLIELKDYYNKDNTIVAKTKENYKISSMIFNTKVNFHSMKVFMGDSFRDLGYNSGFYIISKDKFESNYLYNHINNLIEVQKEQQLFKFGTQVIMNLLTYEEHEFIDYKWNTNQKDKSVKIIHWCGKNKPWLTDDKVWYDYYNKFKKLK